MKKIVPFKKDIIFKTNLAEITSISLEHTLSVEKENLVKGEFTVSGEYKMLETSVNTDQFSYVLPFVVDIDEKYILDNALIDIDDFYYEIMNDNILSVSIEVLIDKIEEKKIEESVEEKIEEVTMEEKVLVREELPLEQNNIHKSERVISATAKEKRCIETEDVKDIFSQIDSSETYKSYTIYIMRENDSIESIISTYNVTKEELEMYNDLSDVKIGDKIIIPAND